MYVCLCNAYTETDIRAAAAEGARTADEAYCSIGDGPCCRRCITEAQQIIDEVHAGTETLSGRRRPNLGHLVAVEGEGAVEAA